MKKTWLLPAILALCGLFCGKPQGDVAVTVVKTPTIVCGSCVKTIETAVAKLDGIESVKGDLKTKTVEVKYLPAKTTVSAVEEAITGAGYNANDKKRDPNAFEKLDACCKVDG
ncbi:MAG TPA: heavy metal-associated domain-containing protein [Bacteroidota bacterium]|nr:heavy metal-associated domain-containing protein [Bacteroidota bacterium]